MSVNCTCVNCTCLKCSGKSWYCDVSYLHSYSQILAFSAQIKRLQTVASRHDKATKCRPVRSRLEHVCKAREIAVELSIIFPMWWWGVGGCEGVGGGGGWCGRWVSRLFKFQVHLSPEIRNPFPATNIIPQFGDTPFPTLSKVQSKMAESLTFQPPSGPSGG